jgi:cytochrome c-type biogenesis protein CcmH
VKRVLVTFAGALALAAPAAASEQHPTQRELETEIVCPVCKPETLDQSTSPIAQRMKRFIARRIAAGDTKSEIKDALVAQFGKEVLAAPEKRGFDLLAWLLPLVGITVAAAVVGLAAWRWSRARPPAVAMDPAQNGRGTIEPELERRLDQELARFDS